MVTPKKKVVEGLSQILPTDYELFCQSGAVLPHITYTEYNNYDDTVTNSFYSNNVEMMIKLWVDKVADLDTYSVQIDEFMHSNGWRLESSNELSVDDKVVRMFVYSAHWHS